MCEGFTKKNADFYFKTIKNWGDKVQIDKLSDTQFTDHAESVYFLIKPFLGFTHNLGMLVAQWKKKKMIEKVMVLSADRGSRLYLCDFEWREYYCDLHSLCRCTTITIVQLQHNEVWVTYKSLSITNSVIWNNRSSVLSHPVESNQFSWP